MKRNRTQAIIKRAVDITASSVGLVVLSPLMLVVALLILIDSGWPVFYRQVRIGRHFQPFRILKFRTMISRPEGSDRQLTVGSDPRITRVGSVLRRSKIDELPQLINVLIGDMSLVGPRPEVGEYVEMFRSDYREILQVRPGLTDPASLQFSHESELLAGADDPEQMYVNDVLPEKLRLSREYLSRASLIFDLQLILRTLLRVVSTRSRVGQGAGLTRSG